PPTPNAPVVNSNQTPVHQDYQKPTAPDLPQGKPTPGPSKPVLSDLNSCKPSYPPASLRSEEEGTVRIRFVVGANGQLSGTPSIVSSSGSSALDKAAVKSLSKCNFKPAYKEGTPVEAALEVDYVWKLDQ
ncbi:MAG TPA: TonB family protein, partial [Burkholderiaceae bacterium]|nr:TonB family protein [Burkholderiaceae bacterium]